MNRTLYVGVWLMLLLIMSTLGTYVYFLQFHMSEPVTLNVQPFKINQEVYKGGDNFSIFVDFCKHTDVPAKIINQYENGIVYNIPDGISSGIQPGCYAFWSTPRILPTTLPPGTYTYSGILEYKVNPFAVRHVRYKSEPFEVIS